MNANENEPTFTDEELEAIERLFDLAREGKTVELKEALDSGVPADLTNSKGDTLLILAAYYKHADAVLALLGAGADPNRVNDMGQTALSAATFRNDVTIVRSLLAHGADPHAGPQNAVAAARQFGLTEMESIFDEHATETNT